MSPANIRTDPPGFLESLKEVVRHVPVLGRTAQRLSRLLPRAPFPGSAGYWERRYAHGGTSGSGSYGKLAEFKAEVLNQFIRDHQIRSVIEFGCGDGNQLSLADYPQYIGLDVSRSAIIRCQSRFLADTRKSFFLYEPRSFLDNVRAFSAEAALSIDVLFHVVEDDVFEMYMSHLFGAAERYVIIYSSDIDLPTWSPHERHRLFTSWIASKAPEWKLLERIPNRYPYADDDNGSASDFYIYYRPSGHRLWSDRHGRRKVNCDSESGSLQNLPHKSSVTQR